MAAPSSSPPRTRPHSPCRETAGNELGSRERRREFSLPASLTGSLGLTCEDRSKGIEGAATGGTPRPPEHGTSAERRRFPPFPGPPRRAHPPCTVPMAGHGARRGPPQRVRSGLDRGLARRSRVRFLTRRPQALTHGLTSAKLAKLGGLRGLDRPSWARRNRGHGTSARAN